MQGRNADYPMNEALFSSPDKYDTAINVIGGLETSEIIFNFLESHFAVSGQMTAPIATARTELSSDRIDRMLRSVVFAFRGEQHRELLSSLIQNPVPAQDRVMVLFWHLALNNRLFREISIRVFAKSYISGRAGLGKDDVVGYLKEFLVQNQALGLAWSESTITTLATKFLNFMTKLNFLSGTRSKSFRTIRLSGEALVLFLYFTKIHQPEIRNLFAHELLPLCFMSKEELVARLKKLSVGGAFALELTGVALNIDPSLPYGELCHAIYR